MPVSGRSRGKKKKKKKNSLQYVVASLAYVGG